MYLLYFYPDRECPVVAVIATTHEVAADFLLFFFFFAGDEDEGDAATADDAGDVDDFDFLAVFAVEGAVTADGFASSP